VEEDLGLDELDQIELQMQLEKRLGIVFTPYQSDNMATVEDYVTAIKNKEDRS
jgi:acyl carrier protein